MHLLWAVCSKGGLAQSLFPVPPYSLSSHCLRPTLATESRIKHVASESPHRNMNAAARMAVGKRGTSPVVKYSVTMGMPRSMPMAVKMRATSEKSLSGR